MQVHGDRGGLQLGIASGRFELKLEQNSNQKYLKSDA